MLATTRPATLTPPFFQAVTLSVTFSASTERSACSSASCSRCSSSASMVTSSPFFGRRETCTLWLMGLTLSSNIPQLLRNGELDAPCKQLGLRLGGERLGCALYIGSQMANLRPWRISLRHDVARQRGHQRVTVLRRQRAAIGVRAAIEHLRELLHALRHTRVADAEFAQRMIHVLEEPVGECLRRMEKRGGAAARALEEQEHVDRDHRVAADRRVRHIPLGVETRLPRGCHDCLIERVRDLAIGVAAESPQKLEH